MLTFLALVLRYPRLISKHQHLVLANQMLTTALRLVSFKPFSAIIIAKVTLVTTKELTRTVWGKPGCMVTLLLASFRVKALCL